MQYMSKTFLLSIEDMSMSNVHFNDVSCSAYLPYRKSVNFIYVAKLTSFL